MKKALTSSGLFKIFVVGVLRSVALAGALSISQVPILVSKAFAADRNTNTYDLCVKRAVAAPAASAAEDAGGLLGFEEYLINSCGFLPVRHSRDGRIRLMSSDCDELFKWAENGQCNVDAFAGYQSRFLKHLDPSVFSISVYERTCPALAHETNPLSRADFEKLVCTILDSKHIAKNRSQRPTK